MLQDHNASGSAHLTVIEPGGANRHYWGDLWRHRELLLFLAWRDISVRYKQTLLGLAWAVLRPLMMMIIFTVVFERIAGLTSGPVPYSLMVFAGIVPWLLFASVLADVGNSIVSNAGMISKVYFPRLIAPLSAMVVGLFDFLLIFVMLLILLAVGGVMPSWRILAIPVFLLAAVMSSFGLGLWVAALSIKYRDLRFVVGFALQLGFYISPVGFSASAIPEEWRLVYSLNPMAGVIDGFRWALLPGADKLYWPGVFASFLIGSIVCVTAIRHFRKSEKTFADEI